jgi:hypothetical protein
MPSSHPKSKEGASKSISIQNHVPSRALVAAVLSGFLHAGIGIALSQKTEAMENDQKRMRIKGAPGLLSNHVNGLPNATDKKQYKDILRSIPEVREDLGNFFLETEYHEGRLTPEELKRAQETLDASIQYYQELLKSTEVGEVLNSLIRGQGNYSTKHSCLNQILNEKKGNCEARAKFMAVVLNRLGPKIPKESIKFQLFRNHIRTVVLLNGDWYTMEKPSLAKLEKKDLENTALIGLDSFIKSYLGEKIEAQVELVEKNASLTTTPMTDSYFELELAEGISKNDLRDFSDNGFDGEIITGMDYLDNPIRKLRNSAGGTIEIEWIDKEEAERLKKIQHEKNPMPAEFYNMLCEEEKKLAILYRDKKYEEFKNQINPLMFFALSSLKSPLEDTKESDECLKKMETMQVMIGRIKAMIDHPEVAKNHLETLCAIMEELNSRKRLKNNCIPNENNPNTKRWIKSGMDQIALLRWAVRDIKVNGHKVDEIITAQNGLEECEKILGKLDKNKYKFDIKDIDALINAK